VAEVAPLAQQVAVAATLLQQAAVAVPRASFLAASPPLVQAAKTANQARNRLRIHPHTHRAACSKGRSQPLLSTMQTLQTRRLQAVVSQEVLELVKPLERSGQSIGLLAALAASTHTACRRGSQEKVCLHTSYKSKTSLNYEDEHQATRLQVVQHAPMEMAKLPPILSEVHPNRDPHQVLLEVP
jgi:hypothetical protein